MFWRYAGARRYAYNHHLARVRDNLETRAAELDAGVARDHLTPGVSWSKFSFINEFNQYKTGRTPGSPGTSTHPVRCTGPKALRLPTIGDVRVHGSTRRLRRMMATGRFHPHSASVSYSKGRWWVSVQGVAAQFHHQRRNHTGRHHRPAGLDAGVKRLAVIADTDGHVLRIEDSMRALNCAQQQLRTANKALARTEPGSIGRARAKARLNRIHARIAWIRHHQHHHLSHWAATTLSSLTVEDLNVAGMSQLRSLARHVADAGIGDLGRNQQHRHSCRAGR